MKRRVLMLSKLGVQLKKDARILDFGCGTGSPVYSLFDQGYSNVIGHDIFDRLELRDPADLSRFFIGGGGQDAVRG